MKQVHSENQTCSYYMCAAFGVIVIIKQKCSECSEIDVFRPENAFCLALFVMLYASESAF